ncbi:hypothetical protein M422DRAFT_239626 [Sphaerobolus stellatus SS14]|nr:hypothetical protein M422DRAFT_239626 [Sphaerobolus stellatus SS14]
MDYASVRDAQALDYARGALELRKKRNRKRTLTGEYVWTEEADLIFALALIAWTSDPSCRIGTKRSFFLESFLSEHGIKKSRKQIASRLQVLKGEWHNSPYSDLLKHPNDAPESRDSSVSPPLHEDRNSRSLPQPTGYSRSQTLDMAGSQLTHDLSSSGCHSANYGEHLMSSLRATPGQTKPYQQFDNSRTSNSSLRGPEPLFALPSSQSLLNQPPPSSLGLHTSEISKPYSSMQVGRHADVSAGESYNFGASSLRTGAYEQSSVIRDMPSSTTKSYTSHLLNSSVDSPTSSMPRNSIFPARDPSSSLSPYPAQRPLAGSTHDYASISQLSRAALNEPHLDMNRRQTFPSSSLSHALNDALVTPAARYPNNTYPGGFGAQGSTPIVPSMDNYNNGSFQSSVMNEGGESRDALHQGSYHSAY